MGIDRKRAQIRAHTPYIRPECKALNMIRCIEGIDLT